jgi:Spy/CpxP family protein refolding chaperone
MALILIIAFSSPIIMLGQEKVYPIQAEKTQRKSRIANLAHDLNLTDNKVAQVREIHESYKPRFEEAKKAEDDAERKLIVKEIRAEEKSAINAQLTPEQQEQFKDYHLKKKKEKMHKMQPKK